MMVTVTVKVGCHARTGWKCGAAVGNRMQASQCAAVDWCVMKVADQDCVCRCYKIRVDVAVGMDAVE